MKTTCLFLLLGFSFFTKGQDTLVTDSSRRPKQFEVAMMALPFENVFNDPLLFASFGLDYPFKRSKSWYFNGTVHTASYQGDTYAGVSGGAYYQLTKKHFFFSAGANAGLSYVRDGYIGPFAFNVIPRLEVGGKIHDVILCAGIHAPVVPYFYPSGFRKFDFDMIYVPYIKLIFTSKKNSRQEQTPGVIAPGRTPRENQADTVHVQYGLAGMSYRLGSNLFIHAGAEVNIPARKPGWYNSFVAGTHFRMRDKWLNDYYTLGFGKKFEFVHKHTYVATGLTIGTYFHRQETSYRKYESYGLNLSTHLETGFRQGRFVLAAGVWFTVNGGYQESRFPDYRTTSADFFVIPSPYIKLLF